MTNTALIIDTAQQMTRDDAIDFIDKHCTASDIVEWMDSLDDEEMPLFAVHGYVPKVDDNA